jgi:citrate synthase
MVTLPAEYEWLQKENEMLAAQMEELRAELCSKNAHPGADAAVVTEPEDEMETESEPANKQHECDECGMVIQRVCVFLAHLRKIMFHSRQGL